MSEKLTAAQLAAIGERCEKIKDDYSGVEIEISPNPNEFQLRDVLNDWVECHKDVPALLAHIAAQDAEMAELRGLVREMGEQARREEADGPLWGEMVCGFCGERWCDGHRVDCVLSRPAVRRILEEEE